MNPAPFGSSHMPGQQRESPAFLRSFSAPGVGGRHLSVVEEQDKGQVNSAGEKQ